MTMPRKTLPRIASVRAGKSPLSLIVEWVGGGAHVVDVTGPVMNFRVFAPLREMPELLRQVRVGEFGTDVVWTDDIDMSADMLWRLAQEQTGFTMSAEGFRRWREHNAFTLDSAAAALGISRRMVAYYEAGEKPIPRVVALATKALEAA
jgi:Protein of unknown function (DUF2442)